MESTMINDDFQDKKYRDAFVDAMIRTGIAFQIKALRKRIPWSQKDLGESMSTPQNVISRYENPDYSGFTLKTLQRLASAFDVALIVKFATFGELRRLTTDRSPEKLAVDSFVVEQESDVSSSTRDSTATVTHIQTGITDYSKFENETLMINYLKDHSQNDPIYTPPTDVTDIYEYSHASH